MPRTIQVPESMADLFADPQRVADAFRLLNALAGMEVHLVPPSNVAPLAAGQKPIRGEPPNLVLPLPLKFRRSISDSSATAASASAQLNLLLAELRATGQLPS